MDPFGMSPDQYAAAGTWAAAIATFLTLGVIAATAIYAKRQVDHAQEQLNEARELRLQQSRPYVVVSIDIEQQFIFMLSVENISSTAAYNVRIDFDTPPASTTRDVEELRILREPIPTMPPGHRYRTYWESALTVFDKKRPYPHPMSYAANVSYEDHHGRQFGPDRYILDFRVFEGQAAGVKGIAELIKAVETIGSQQKRWMERGLLVRARDDDAAERKTVRPFRIRRALQAWDDGGWREVLRWYANDVSRRKGLYEQPGRRRKKADGD